MDATRFETARLVLLPLQVGYAAQMAAVLADPALYTFTGGEPPTAEALENRYERQVAGPEDKAESWLNWVISRDDELVGYVQATVISGTAEVAWVLGTSAQGHGYAKEAAIGLVNWLTAQGTERVIAHVHPDHSASARVAAATGLVRTEQLDDGEYLWESKKQAQP
jgi:RimJ/RimL family protein N-acetyltransferase